MCHNVVNFRQLVVVNYKVDAFFGSHETEECLDHVPLFYQLMIISNYLLEHLDNYRIWAKCSQIKRFMITHDTRLKTKRRLQYLFSSYYYYSGFPSKETPELKFRLTFFFAFSRKSHSSP